MTEKIARNSAVRLESQAIVAGVIAGVAGGLFALVVFWDSWVPLWGGWSVGTVATGVAGAVSLIAGAVAYYRSRAFPSQQWRRGQKAWKLAIDAITIAIMHLAIALLATIAAFVTLQAGFREITVGPVTSTASVAVAAGLVGYWVYVSSASMSTQKLAGMLVVFVAVGSLASMATSEDPRWWEYHFSQLGTFGDISSKLFNLTLVVGGVIVSALASYIGRDMEVLADARVLRRRSSLTTVPWCFVVMGLMLAGVGAVPVNVNEPIHNLCAMGMAIAFGVLLIGSPWLLSGMPRAFFGMTGVALVVLLASVYGFLGENAFNLTAFELAAFALIFAWLVMFIRFLAALGASLPPQPAAVDSAE